MNVVLGLVSALCAGTSDFLGGLGSRHGPALVVTAVSQGIGCVVAVLIALVAGGEPTAADLWWGSVAGIGGSTGLLSIYAGYAKARVSIAAPVAGVGTAAIPVVVDVATGDDLSGGAAAGIVLGLAAIGMVSVQRAAGTGSVARSLAYGLGGAAGLGFLLVCLGQTSDDGGVWTVAPTRAVGFVLMIGVVAATRTPLRLPRVTVPHVVGIGVLGTSANALFVGAAKIGPVSTAAVLVAMFPAVTVLWARGVFHERLRPVQWAGLVVATAAVALIAGG